MTAQSEALASPQAAPAPASGVAGNGQTATAAAPTPKPASVPVAKQAPAASANASAASASGNGAGKGPSAISSSLGGPLSGTAKVAFATQADAPSCAECGSIMVRNGSCYKCLNCGSTSGCS